MSDILKSGVLICRDVYLVHKMYYNVLSGDKGINLNVNAQIQLLKSFL